MESKNYYKLISIIISILYISPLLFSGYLYSDDIIRMPYPYGWDHNGRYFATIISLLFGNGSILNIFPSSTILSVVILCYSAFLFVDRYIQDSTLYLKVLCSISIVISPFYLDNLSYQFDNLQMSIALSLSIISALFCVESSIKNKILSLIMMVISISIYQASINSFISMVLLCFVAEIINKNKSLLYLFKSGLSCIFVLISSFAIYKIFIYNHDNISEYTKMRSEILPLSVESISLISLNTEKYIKYISLLFSGMIGFLLAFFYAMPIIVSCYLSIIKKISYNRLFSLLIIYFLIFLLSFGSLLILKNPPVSGRALLSFPLLTMCSVLFINKFKFIIFQKLLCVVTVVISFIYMSSFYEMTKISNETYTSKLNVVSSIINNNNTSNFKKVYLYSVDNLKGISGYKKSFPLINTYIYNYLLSDWYLNYYSINKINYKIYYCDNNCKNKVLKNGQLLISGINYNTYHFDKNLFVIEK
ncbi:MULTISPECIES: glucosyltransferase domain-containing protein [Proteus]|uniref:glucosyltransferase domain-containing protein n=1 Tax=Proteus TaxID=583 RepID=UPI00137839A3|nr:MULTISPECIES: glucosyltransferase domain-containing protein [Proteus]MCX2588208.1 glucosyltransferase domain-containing protein [Proteus penneri]NBL91645.1 hypothetical protein [Proteus sp. G2673]